MAVGAVGAVASVVAATLHASLGLHPDRSVRPAPFDISKLAATLTVQFEEPPTLGRAAMLSVSGLVGADNASLTRISILHETGAVSYRSEQWVPVTEGRARLVLGTRSMSEAGHHTIIVFTDRQHAVIDAEVGTAPTMKGFAPLVGPHRVTADGVSKVLVSVNPHGTFASPARDGSTVRLAVRRPDGTVDEYSGTIDNLIAGIVVPSTTVVGVATVVATIDGAPSEPVDFLQVAGPPAHFKLATPDLEVPADGRSNIVIVATEVVDAHGNRVSEGTHLTARTDNGRAEGFASATTVNGSARFVICAPTTPGPFTVTVSGSATEDMTATLTVNARPAVTTIGTTWDQRNHRVNIGPVMSPSGGFVADGTVAVVSRDGTEVARAQVIDGVASITVPAEATDPTALRVTVLGVSEAVER